MKKCFLSNLFCVSLHVLLFPVDVNANLDETVNICHYQKQIMTDAQNEQPKKRCSMVSCIGVRIPNANM